MATILRLLAAASAALVLVGTPAGAAEPDLPKLGITPVGQDGDFFQLTLEPGAVHTLEVELANQGDLPIAARTYAADVATIVNGGFGAGLRDAPSGGTTSWVDYPADVFQLDPDQAVNRTFTVTVPAATPPGEYITSLVIENDEPVRGSGDVAVEQVLRQAIAVAVTVPGPLRGALTVGGNGSHTVVGGESLVAVGVANTGNRRLEPTGELVVADGAGAVLARIPVRMESFYAGTETEVEMPVGTLLDPGRYFATLTLGDPERGVAPVTGPATPFDVEADPALAQGVGARVDSALETVRSGGVPLWALTGALAGALAFGAAMTIGVSRLRRRRTRTELKPHASGEIPATARSRERRPRRVVSSSWSTPLRRGNDE
jgi:hypothetical protein